MLDKFIKNKNSQEYGFTLIELLVVILIIGVLASIAIPAFMNQKKRSIDAQTQSDVRNVNISIMTWVHDNPQNLIFRDQGVREIRELASQSFSPDSTLILYGTPQDYCIKAFNPNGKDYRNTGAHYFIYKSITGEAGPANVLGHASRSSCDGFSRTIY